MINNYQNYNKNKRLNIILFNGTLCNHKGQIDFLNNIESNIIKDYILLFIGKERNYSFSECLQIATQKNIKLICIPFIQSNYLYKIVTKCKYQINYCINTLFDANPRSITEGLYAGLPYLVSNTVQLPKIIENNKKIGYICKANNKIDLNEKVLKLLKLDNSYLEKFVKNYLEMNKVCNNLVIDILENYKSINYK